MREKQMKNRWERYKIQKRQIYPIPSTKIYIELDILAALLKKTKIVRQEKVTELNYMILKIIHLNKFLKG